MVEGTGECALWSSSSRGGAPGRVDERKLSQ